MVWAYIFMGILDAMWQTTAYWLMGAMSNDPSKLAYFAGFCAYLVMNLGIYAYLVIRQIPAIRWCCWCMGR